jgi:hypothetical protein
VKIPLVARLVQRWHARYFVRAMYQAILERDADHQSLATYSATLRRKGDLIGLARSIASSDEAIHKAWFAKPAPLVSAAFRGLLGRDPEPEALATYSNDLADHKSLSTLLDAIGQSEEHWRRSLATHAETVVRAAFLALLNRDPEPEALALYVHELQQTTDISALLSIVVNSAEHRDLLQKSSHNSTQLLRSDDLPALLTQVIQSPTVWNELASRRFPQPAPASNAYEQEAWVFIHAQKTGGTSLQNMLAETFGHRIVFREKIDTLYRRSPAELADYSVFAGHFDFDSVAYIPRRLRRLFTFLREPRQRLLSLYRFLRAHEPGTPAFEGSKEIANRLNTEEFFRSVMALASGDIWNHLTWCVMGQRKWNTYRQLLSGADDLALTQRLDNIRVEIRDRLQQFAFIGLQEDYVHSSQQLFELIGANVPHVRHDHSIESLSANARYFKYVPRQPLTEQLAQAMAPLVQLDDIVYQEGCNLYAARWRRIDHGGEYRSL